MERLGDDSLDEFSKIYDVRLSYFEIAYLIESTCIEKMFGYCRSELASLFINVFYMTEVGAAAATKNIEVGKHLF